ncbi:MAG: tyrosine phosphatase family protein [Beijerinckiaceae bacterium]
MPRIHVCSLTRIADTVRETGARSMVTLINPLYPVTRPAEIEPALHLHISVSDIIEHLDGHVAPDVAHVQDLLRFVRAWDRAHPLLIHCYAGVSRSTAAAYVSACALRPDFCEFQTARKLRMLSPTATPNARIVAIADNLLGRGGRMTAAIGEIGRGEDCFEGAPFALEIGA